MEQSPYTFFWETASPFSQWHPSHFCDAASMSFHTAEQYMMFHKALLFKDFASSQRILRAKHPREQKELGRGVMGFDATLWESQREAIVYQGNKLKFMQNPSLLKHLLETRGTDLVEASPDDCIWGIGWRASDPQAQDPTQWRGLNLLGKILTRLREDIWAYSLEGDRAWLKA